MRSSWLMLARNSDLYLEVSASCSAFSGGTSRTRIFWCGVKRIRWEPAAHDLDPEEAAR